MSRGRASIGKCSERRISRLPWEGIMRESYHGFHGEVLREENITASMGRFSEKRISRLLWESILRESYFGSNVKVFRE